MNRVILMVSLVLSGFSLQAQHQFGISLNAGISEMQIKDELHLMSGVFQTASSPSFTSDLSYSFRKNNVSFETGLGYTFIAGSYHSLLNITNVDDGSITTMKSEKEHRTNYLNIPLIINYHFNKLNIGFGTQFLYNISGNLNTNIFSSRQGSPYSLISVTQTGSALTNTDFGALFKANYLLSPRISIQARAYWGLADINNNHEKGAAYDIVQLDDPVNRIKLANRQFTIGLKYLIKS